jgi:uncharacterized protein (TIRG00374 family)
MRRRWIRRLLELLLLGALLFLAVDLIGEVGWGDLAEQLRSASLPHVVVATLLLLARYVAWNTRWQCALRRVGVTGAFLRGMVALLAAAAVNHLTPSFRIFGGLLRARYISRARRVSFQATYGAVLFDQIANQTVMGVLSAISFVAVALRLERAGQAFAGALAVISLFLLLPLLVRRLRLRRRDREEPSDDGILPWIGRWLRRQIARGREILSTIEHLIRDVGLVVQAIVLSLAYAAFNIGAAWVAFEALGYPVALSSVFLTVSLGVTIGALSGTPGGSLTTEAAMVTCYGLLGVDGVAALAATLLYRGLHYLIILTLGVPSLVSAELLHRRIAARDRGTGRDDPSS